MNEYIYYPGFEVHDPNWLKFALLYLNKLDPIIPFSGDPHLSEQWKRISNETDLLDIHRPEVKEGRVATLDAVDQMDKILMHPERYEFIFNTPNIVERWRNPSNQTWPLFGEKYSHTWEKFCLQNRIARHSDHGLRLPREVCLIYMSILAQCIADYKGVPPITDYKQLDQFSIFTRQATPQENDIINTAQSIIQLEIPRNLNELSVEKFIEIRKREGFKDKQGAFHIELNKFIKSIEEGKKIEDFSDFLGSTWSDFREDIFGIGVGVASFSLGVWIFLQSSGVGLPAALEKVAGGISIALGSTVAIKKTWQHTKNARLTRKYLADLGGLV